MIILKTILIVLLIIIVVLIAIILLLLFIPFKYNLNIIYKNEERIELNLKFIIFRISGYFAYSPNVDFELKLWNKVLLKKNNGKEEEVENNSIGDTNFIENKNLLDDVKESKKAIKDLFVSAKKLNAKQQSEYEKEQEELENRIGEVIDDDTDKEVINIKKELQKEKAFNFIDKFKNILDNDIIYVIKRVVNEGINVLSIIKPKKYKVTIKKGTKDPYAMGMTLAMAAPLYAILGDNLKVVKNSESEYTSSIVNMIGYPRLYKLIPPIISLYKDKRFMKIVATKKK